VIYTPTPSQAKTVEDLRRWAASELLRIATASRAAQTPTIPLTTAAPDKPVTGQLVLADGTAWNPGSGRGLYYFDGTWKFIA
jgi:hypothetical protein